MLVDFDVIIWNWRGNDKAAALLATAHGISVSAVSYMELVQGMRNQREWKNLQADLKLWQASVLPITETISVRAVKLVEAHFRSHHLQLADALIAATALDIACRFSPATSNISKRSRDSRSNHSR